MKSPTNLPRIALFAAFALGVAAAFWPITGSASTNMGEWVQTPRAIARTQAGECDFPNTGRVCVELCDDFGPTGRFTCAPME